MEEINEISPGTAFAYINSGALLIDVREKYELEQEAFDIQNVLNVSYSRFDENYQDIPKDRKLVIACHLGVRSYRVAQFLIYNGWNPENIFSLEGGIDAWEHSKLPVKKVPKSFSMAKPASSCGCGSGSSDSCC
ncbi:MAG: rhodanese-like domain-containing protein [Paludibacter sp.]|jgi:rhodanese-related sulfurtransferase|nr:rhodanese-like domain-containing protein [Paludibacter sp.]